MIELCMKCFESKSIGSFFCDQAESGKHLTGYIAAYKEDELLIKHISPSGYYDGFILIHISDLIRVDIAGQYEQKISTLYALREQKHPNLNCAGECIFLTLMEFAQNNKLIVSLELDDCVLSGFVQSFSEDHVHLEMLDEYGRTDGDTYLLSDDILSVALDTSTEQNIKLLNSHTYASK